MGVTGGEEELVDVVCGDDGCSREGHENEACFPIDIPAHDPDFVNNQKCLMFVRSEVALPDDCMIGRAPPLN